MNQLFFYCFGCRDRRPVGTERRYCLCGAVSARATGGTVMLAGPGDVIAGGDDPIRIVRPSPVGT